MSLTRPDVNAKQMFFIGLFGLPWLWVVNVMYHFRAVYGNGNTSTDGEGENDENAGILGGMMSESEDNGKLRLNLQLFGSFTLQKQSVNV